MIGETVGAYTILSELGRGGMGVVFLAEHRHLGWKAAIKFLQPEFSERPDALNRFFTEARAASLIDHDGIVRVLDCDVHQPSSQAYIVMEYLEGHTLREYMAWRGRMSVTDVAAVMGRVADALAAAHEQGIVHRDLKPDNIFVLTRPPGAVKIVDFGVAKLNRGGALSSTLSGTVIGTPLYMSPEQARGTGTLDGRADIYSLGCILFEMLCGRPPFVYSTSGEVITAHLAQLPPTPELFDATVPPPLRELVERMLAKAPDDRPGLTGEVIPTLRAFASIGPVYASLLSGPGPTAELVPPQVPAPRRRKAGWLLLGVAAGAAALFAWLPWQERPATSETTATPAIAPERYRAAPAEPEPAPIPPAPVATPPRSEAQRPRTRPAPTATRAAVAATRAAARPPRPTPTPTPTSDGEVRLALSSDPAGAVICTPGTPGKLGTTNGSFALRTDNQRTTLLLYHPGYHIEKLVIAGDANATRSVRLRPLTDDDLQPPPPCR